MKMKKAIIIFTRVPEAGKTKTRMMPYFSGKQCAKLHECFLKDIKRECEKVDADVFVFCTPKGKEEKLYPIFGKKTTYYFQSGETLGERMCNAMEAVFKKGYEASILIGTDIPEIKAQDLNQAFFKLQENDIVFGPSMDGGYYLIGMKKLQKAVFEQQSYGHGEVLRNTVQQLTKRKYKVGYTRQLYDMDTRKDLIGYRKRMRQDKSLKNTWTSRYLMHISKISVIIPTYNEEKTIVELQERLLPYQNQCEIIFVDGGSTDRTLELIRPEFKVIHSKKGRANQMNIGAQKSQGDILFFLHCDSELPTNFLQEIREVMQNVQVGCFGIAFHSKNFFMFTCRVISNHRIKDRKVMFGDQGIFIERELFFEVGMFPTIPIMEDYQFSLNLKAQKEKLGITKHRIYTSDRRFPKGTLPKLKVMWKMNRLRKMYRDGVDIEEISKMYRDIR